MKREVYLWAYTRMCAESHEEIAPDGRYKFQGAFLARYDGVYLVPIVRIQTEPFERVSIVGYGQIIYVDDISLYRIPTRAQLDAYQVGDCALFEKMPGYQGYL